MEGNHFEEKKILIGAIIAITIGVIAFHKLNEGDTKLYSSATNTQVTNVANSLRVTLAV